MQRHALVRLVLTYTGAISACEKGQQRQQAVDLLQAMQRHATALDVMTYNAAISMCGQGQQRQLALNLVHALQHQAIVPQRDLSNRPTYR